jgi:formylglycine-generating enzyme required for sulfatase activity
VSEPLLAPFNYESLTLDAQGQVAARQAHTTQGFMEPLAGGVSLTMLEIPAGRFSMGSPRSQGGEDERPQHLVSVGRFFMARGLVTQAQWRAVTGRAAAGRFRGDDLPVENVSWNAAQAFCERLARQSGRAYRLPSEAQWEYACRAGTGSAFHTGPTLSGDLANYCAEHTFQAEPAGPYRHTTTPAGMFPPNGFGLYDMHGNLWEWCADTWHDDYNGAPLSDAPRQNGGDRAGRAVRGGSWHDVPSACRSAARTRYEAGQGDDFVGFRVILVD